MSKKKAEKEDNFLRYVTKADAKVRHTHALLHYVVKKAEDSFWDIYCPPNGWNCRCTLEKMLGKGITSTNTIGLNLHKTVPDIFKFNSAKEKKVFTKKHPYYKVKKKDKKIARVNFKMKIPK